MKKWTFCLSCLLAFQLTAVETTSAPQENERLKVLNKEIEQLDKKIDEFRLKEMNKEMESQPYMFDQWHQYADKMEEAENFEETAHTLETRRDELIRERDKLLQEK